MATVRPKLTPQMLAGIAIVAAILVIRGLTDIGHARSAMADVILFGPLAVAALVVLATALLNSRLILDHDTVTHVSFIGHARTWPRSAVSRVDRFSTTSYRSTTRYVVFVGSDGRALFTLTSAIWDVNAVVAACRHAGIHLTGQFSDFETPLGLNRRIPGVTTWRSWIVAVLIVVAIVVLAVIATLLYGPSSGG
jgi:hypothetical protein